MTQRLLAALAIFLVALAGSVPARAQFHSDIEIYITGGPVAGSRLQVRFFGDRTLLVNGQQAFDHQTGYGLWPANFRDIAGGPFGTDDPGFQAFRGTFLADEQLFYRPLGTAQYWNPATRVWGAAPAGSAIRVEGTVPDEVAIDAIVFEIPQAIALYNELTTPTYITGGGIIGPQRKMIDVARPDGSFHTHLNWFLETPSGVRGGPDGAYMVTLQIIDPTGKYVDSQPFNVLFNSGLTAADYTSAYLARIEAPSGPLSPAPEPHTVAMLVAGLAMVMLRRRMTARAVAAT